jgi:kynurenine formamidase
MERCLTEKNWGAYAGGDAPGVKFENCYWCQEKEIAAICSDTWGVEVRPNETKEVNQPWHWVVIPAMGASAEQKQRVVLGFSGGSGGD